MTVEGTGLGALFVSAFLAATLLPGGSEAVLALLAVRDEHEPWLLLAVASTGNTLGGMSTWAVGRFFGWWFPASRFTQPKYDRPLRWLRQWGSPALLLSWVPVVGDSLCLVGGWLRVPWLTALVWIAIGKALRYGVILYAVL
ncbi:MAG: DedA family protein [Nitrospira sp. SB0677_bin_15]|nr:DedA family protein [Nitrospira sp. SB0667_bin_9]MYD31847.1 DedA family protein [Nitrospira sp. SB0661_bin_20]MYG40149.1 DedA family protein [Nitrospira sp. SB0677_bin_15]MYH01057.1 DedA family protein [Nitrospira sp. SB0675_bin_23]MYJ22629.1 DedA family protein [Nitrospira sp. SB0673_bin_12]